MSHGLFYGCPYYVSGSWEHFSCVALCAGLESFFDFIKNILICVPKMNEGLVGLERCEGE